MILPYYNEEKYLSRTLESWKSQIRQPDELILVDNLSRDRSCEIALEFKDVTTSFQTECITEKQPGKIFSLAAGIHKSKGNIIVLSDADTYYPPHYLKLAEELLLSSDASVSAVMALPQYRLPDNIFSHFRRRFYVMFHKVWRKHCFTGGYAQIFRRKALEAAGGFSYRRWPFVLLDHEIMYRVYQKGTSRYHHQLWCHPSPRRKDRRSVRWNGFERLAYLMCPHAFQGWFFYSFLAPRFRKRGMDQLRLREKPWETNAAETENSNQNQEIL